jgi:hypothetical protein
MKPVLAKLAADAGPRPRRNTSALLAARKGGHRPQSTTSPCPFERRSGEVRRAGCPGCLAAVADRSSWKIADG